LERIPKYPHPRDIKSSSLKSMILRHSQKARRKENENKREKINTRVGKHNPLKKAERLGEEDKGIPKKGK